MLRRPRLWDRLAGYAHVHMSRERVDYGVDWIVDRAVAADPHDQRLLDAWTDDVVGGGLGIVAHVCDPERCVLTLASSRSRGRSGATLTITSRRVPDAVDATRHTGRPLSVLGDGPMPAVRRVWSRRADASQQRGLCWASSGRPRCPR